MGTLSAISPPFDAWSERSATLTIILMARPMGIDGKFKWVPERPAPALWCGWTAAKIMTRSRGVQST